MRLEEYEIHGGPESTMNRQEAFRLEDAPRNLAGRVRIYHWKYRVFF
jgi:hypothetical protein